MLLLRMTLRILMTRETPCFFPAAFFDKHHKSPNVSHTERKKKRNPPRFTLKFFLFSLYLLFTRAKSKSVSQFEKNYPKSRPPDCVSKERKGRERKKNFSRNSISRKKTLEITFKIEAAKTVGNQNLWVTSSFLSLPASSSLSLPWVWQNPSWPCDVFESLCCFPPPPPPPPISPVVCPGKAHSPSSSSFDAHRFFCFSLLCVKERGAFWVFFLRSKNKETREPLLLSLLLLLHAHLSAQRLKPNFLPTLTRARFPKYFRNEWQIFVFFFFKVPSQTRPLLMHFIEQTLLLSPRDLDQNWVPFPSSSLLLSPSLPFLLS